VVTARAPSSRSDLVGVAPDVAGVSSVGVAGCVVVTSAPGDGEAEGDEVWSLLVGEAVAEDVPVGLGVREPAPRGEVAVGKRIGTVGVAAPGVAVGRGGGGVGIGEGAGRVGSTVTGLVSVTEGVGDGMVGV